MALNNVSSGKSLPDDFNVIIEITAHSDPVKYEVDKESGAIFVDRFMGTAMHYPCNYGYIPHTIAGAAPLACWPWKTKAARMPSCWPFRCRS